ncbi:MAG: sulfatase-like hydrolase/transferase [Pseudomonadota bacterium]|nr:sulfatase-like hydrolase/transferase [Pseudomonadota bacterium]
MFVIPTLALLGCDADDSSSSPDPSPEGPIQNVLVLSVDTTRWDQLTSIDTMPFLATKTAESGVRLESLWSTGNWTMPVMPAVQSGVYGFNMGWRLYGADRPTLPGDTPTLAERLGAEGYRSYVDSCNPVFGLTDATRGFETIVECGDPTSAEPGDPGTIKEQLERVEGWIAQSESEHPSTPWIVQLHTNDGHDPNTHPAPECAVASAELAAACPYGTSVSAELLDMDLAYAEVCGAAMKARHDCDVRMMDTHLEDAWARWDASGILTNTVVLLVTDHGENHYEDHGVWPDQGVALPRYWGHQGGMNAQVSRGFGWAWTRDLEAPSSITAATSQVDIVPTALHLLDRDDLATGMDGASMFSVASDRVVTQFACDGIQQWHGASDAEYHMFAYKEMTGTGVETWVMYDIVADPSEVNPMSVAAGPQPLKDTIRAQMDVATLEPDVYCRFR